MGQTIRSIAAGGCSGTRPQEIILVRRTSGRDCWGVKKPGRTCVRPVGDLVPPPGIEPGSQPSEGRILSIEIQRGSAGVLRLRAARHYRTSKSGCRICKPKSLFASNRDGLAGRCHDGRFFRLFPSQRTSNNGLLLGEYVWLNVGMLPQQLVATVVAALL